MMEAVDSLLGSVAVAEVVEVAEKETHLGEAFFSGSLY